MNALEEKSVYVTIPDSGTATTDAAPNGSPNDNTQYNTAKTGTLSVLAASTFGGTTGTNGDTVAGKFTIGGLKIPGSVVKITLESSDA
jgi:hypothetical protein